MEGDSRHWVLAEVQHTGEAVVVVGSIAVAVVDRTAAAVLASVAHIAADMDLLCRQLAALAVAAVPAVVRQRVDSFVAFVVVP